MGIFVWCRGSTTFVKVPWRRRCPRHTCLHSRTATKVGAWAGSNVLRISTMAPKAIHVNKGADSSHGDTLVRQSACQEGPWRRPPSEPGAQVCARILLNGGEAWGFSGARRETTSRTGGRVKHRHPVRLGGSHRKDRFFSFGIMVREGGDRVVMGRFTRQLGRGWGSRMLGQASLWACP